MVAFFSNYDYLVLPVTQVPPFPASQEYVTNINGLELETYIDWMKSCYYLTVTDLPAISIPAGFTPDGLPVGMQIIGKPRQEFEVLQLAFAFERATKHYDVLPALIQPEK